MREWKSRKASFVFQHSQNTDCVNTGLNQSRTVFISRSASGVS